MTVRNAEVTTSVVLILVSMVLMYKSADGLAIGWIPGEGPGSGAWPFGLSAIMLLSSVAIFIRAWLRVTPQSRSEETFMDRFTVKIVGITVLALSVLLLATHFVGLYIGLFAFLFFYLRILGKHSLTTSTVLTLAIPVVVFVFFEYLLIIPLPKGISEPLFYPIYDLMY
jgi:hypothetical protein